MKPLIFIIFIFNITLIANPKSDLFGLYQDKNYKDACRLGMNNYPQYTRDEAFISLYAFSCLEADYIDRLAVPISALKYSKEARSNAAYFSIILMQKKLLYHALIDQYDISALNLPTTDHVLSKVFDFYVKDQRNKNANVFFYTDRKNDKITYKLYIETHPHIKKMVIEVFHDKILSRRHLYW
ncbi:MAG: hypothetical protein U9N52_04930 [Campylobacterota bacterium]|nr:hypothetical protein [Campylobacterota bacterium]